jgi:hypothetical protein
MNEIEGSSKPIVAAIQGSCLGGGLEVGKYQFIFDRNYILGGQFIALKG